MNLYQAIKENNQTEVERILLENTNVNWRNNYGWSALHESCCNGYLDLVSLLIQHPNIDFNLETNIDSTPLILACIYNRYHIVSLLVLIVTVLHQLLVHPSMVIQMAKGKGHDEIVSLLTRYKANPRKICYETRIEIKGKELLIAEIFAMIVLVTNKYMKIRENTNKEIERFFLITSKLPIEIQMLLFHRKYISIKNNVCSKDSEICFQYLLNKREDF